MKDLPVDGSDLHDYRFPATQKEEKEACPLYDPEAGRETIVYIDSQAFSGFKASVAITPPFQNSQVSHETHYALPEPEQASERTAISSLSFESLLWGFVIVKNNAVKSVKSWINLPNFAQFHLGGTIPDPNTGAVSWFSGFSFCDPIYNSWTASLNYLFDVGSLAVNFVCKLSSRLILSLELQNFLQSSVGIDYGKQAHADEEGKPEGVDYSQTQVLLPVHTQWRTSLQWILPTPASASYDKEYYIPLAPHQLTMSFAHAYPNGGAYMRLTYQRPLFVMLLATAEIQFNQLASAEGGWTTSAIFAWWYQYSDWSWIKSKISSDGNWRLLWEIWGPSRKIKMTTCVQCGLISRRLLTGFSFSVPYRITILENNLR